MRVVGALNTATPSVSLGPPCAPACSALSAAAPPPCCRPLASSPCFVSRLLRLVALVAQATSTENCPRLWMVAERIA